MTGRIIDMDHVEQLLQISKLNSKQSCLMTEFFLNNNNNAEVENALTWQH